MQFENACLKSGVSLTPTNWGPKTRSLAISQLKGNFNVLYLRNEIRYISGQVRCKLQGVCYIVSERHELWSTNGFKLDRSFYPRSVNSAFYFIARLRWGRSANETQLHFVKRWGPRKQRAVEKFGVVPLEKIGAKNFYICSVFERLRDLMANICWTKRDINNRARALKSTKDLRCPKISWTLVHKWLKTGPEFLPTLYRFVPVHRYNYHISSVIILILDHRWELGLTWCCCCWASYRLYNPRVIISRPTK